MRGFAQGLRWLVMGFAVTVALQVPAFAQAQKAPDPLDVIDALGPLMKTEDYDGIYSLLSEAVRQARETDSLSGDWAFVFSMFSDHMRNIDENPAYALRLADEGLELLARSGDPDPALGALLGTSRAYALADLGRLEEAAEVARLAAPHLRKAMGDQIADDLLALAVGWDKGELTYLNSSADGLAGKMLDRAFKAVDAGEYGQALSLAAQAVLPEDTGLDPKAVMVVNGRAAVVRGRALYQMRRPQEALKVLYAAVDMLMEPGWQTGPATWRVDPAQMGVAAWQLTFWLGRVAVDLKDYPLGEAAYRITEPLSQGPEDRSSLTYAYVVLAEAQGDFDKVGTLMADNAAKARAVGDLATATLTEFYLARFHANRAPTWEEVDTQEMIRATEAVMAAAVPDGSIEADFILTEAADILVRTPRVDQALIYARAALRAWDERQKKGAATEIERAANAGRSRQIVDRLLLGANSLAERDPSAYCPDEPGRGCVMIVETP